ncbi:hypothetical protein B8W97_13125, partial [Staphylococcus haemolyticus]
IVISVVGLIFTIVMMNEISSDTNRYITDLSYRIHRGEQESLLEMPIGVMILNDSEIVEWANPYMIKYFKDENLLGRKMADIDPDLQKLITKYAASNEFHTITWRDHKFTMLVQKEYNSIYLMDITRCANLEERYNDEQISVGQIFLDNYDEITQSMTDQEISNLSNYVTNELATWSQKYGMFLKQIDDDHFFLLA